ncbi:MAG TPA: tetratricopeptide repeat protein [Candidatus Deferrimicrobiaceae bacterium]
MILTNEKQGLSAILGGVRAATATVRSVGAQGQLLQQGCGFFVDSRGDFVTNRHLLQGGVRASVRTTDGTEYEVLSVVSEHRDGDLVRVRTALSGTAPRAVRFSADLPQVGDRVMVVGGPDDRLPGVTGGMVSGVRDVPLMGPIIQVTAFISAATSGCPVVNQRGEVVGVSQSHTHRGNQYGFAVPAVKLFPYANAALPPPPVPLAEWVERGTDRWLGTEEFVYSKALRCLWAEDFEEALPRFDEVTALAPDNADAWFFAGYCSDALGRFADALSRYGRAIAIRPRFHQAMRASGETHAQMRNYREAADVFRKLAVMRPEDSDVLYLLGEACAHLERWMDAMTAYRKAVRLRPDFAMAWYNLGEACSHLDLVREEAEAFRRVTLLAPEMAVAQNNLGYAYYRMGKYREAVAAYNEAIRIAPDFAVAYDNLGFAWYKLNRLEEAIRAFREAIRIMPDFSEAHNNLGAVLLESRRYREAAASYRQAIRIRPDYADAYVNLGSALTALGRTQDAARALLKAIRFEPGNADARFALGRCWLLLRQRRFALDEYRALKGIDPKMADRLMSIISGRREH